MFSPRNSRNIHKVVSWHEAVGTLCGCLAVLGFLIFSVSFHFKTFILWTHRLNSHIVRYFGTWKQWPIEKEWCSAVCGWEGQYYTDPYKWEKNELHLSHILNGRCHRARSPSRPEPIELSSKVHPVCWYASVPDKMEMGRCTPSNGNCCSKIRDALWNV